MNSLFNAVVPNSIRGYLFTLFASLAICGDANAAGRVFAWGNNSSGQCDVPSGLRAASISAGTYHSVVVTTDGNVVAWGQNFYGQTNVPAGLTNIVAAAGGNYHTFALSAAGVVTAWGSSWGTNLPPGLGSATAIASGNGHGVALLADSRVVSWGWGAGTNVPSALSNIVAVAAGNGQSVALRSDGTVAAWGSGAAATVPGGLANVVAIACGGQHNLALRGDGRVVAWGSGPQGQTNVPAGLSNVIAVAAGGNHSLALRANGTIVSWGWNSDGQLSIPGGLSGVAGIAAGERHSLAVEGDGMPIFTVEPFSQLASVGASISLHAFASGYPPLTYQWYAGETLLAGETSGTLAFTPVLEGDAGSYRCVASNLIGTVTSRVATLTVTDCPSLVTQPSDRSAYAGETVTFSVTAAGALPLAYQWRRNGAPISSATNATLTLSSVHGSDAGAYTVAVSNECGMAVSLPATFQVNTSVALLALTNQWRFDQSGQQIEGWMEPDFDDSAWLSGPGGHGFENNTATVPYIRTTLSLNDPGGQRIRTYYLRTRFNFPLNPAGFSMHATNLLDDGAVVYLNGHEVYRINMPFSAVHNAMLALYPVPEPWFVPVSIPNSYLVNGENVVAVEVHQATTNSSDVVFGLWLTALSSQSGPPAIIVQPKAQQASPGTNIVLTAVAAGEEPLSYQWQKNGSNVPNGPRLTGATTATLTISNFQEGDIGAYTLRVNNSRGVGTSDTASVWFPAPGFRWARATGGTGVEDAHRVVVDRSGNTYVVGGFSGAGQFGQVGVSSAGVEDAFVAKYNRSGQFQWVQTAGGLGNDFARGVAVDTNGNCYVAGYFSGTATFDFTSVTSAGASDLFLAKYSPNGSLIWVRRAGGTQGDLASGVGVDASGVAYITGSFSNTATFGPYSVSSAGGADLFLARCDASGTFQWVIRGGGSAEDRGTAVAVDGQGAPYVTGWFSGTASFPGRTVTSVGSGDVLAAKFNTSGGVVWLQGTGDARLDIGTGISVDAGGNAYVLSVFDANQTSQPPRLKVTRHNASGVMHWDRVANSAFYSDHSSIAADATGCYLTGGFTDNATFEQATILGAGGQDSFVASYDSQGGLRWLQGLGGVTGDFGAGVSVFGEQDVYLCGWFTGTASFGTNTLVSAGSRDFFTARLGNPLDSAALVLGLQGVTNGMLRLWLNGMTRAGQAVLHESTNLVSWTAVQTNAATGGALEFRVGVTNAGRFYRATGED